MDILNDTWMCKYKFKDRVTLHKFLMLCKFAGISIDDYYLLTNNFTGYYGYLDDRLEGWDKIGWARRSETKFEFLSLREAQKLLQEAINKQIKEKEYEKENNLHD